jgi:hypothetical protein
MVSRLATRKRLISLADQGLWVEIDADLNRRRVGND